MSSYREESKVYDTYGGDDGSIIPTVEDEFFPDGGYPA